jgi:hypothetical protein
MKRRRRSGVAETDAEAAEMSEQEFESEIARCKFGYENGGTSQGRKSYFKRLVWLEAQRERLLGIPAPKRRFNGS